MVDSEGGGRDKFQTIGLAIKAKFHSPIWSQTGQKLVADLQRAGI